MTVKLYTEPRPLAGIHVTSRLPHEGQTARGYQKMLSQCSQRGSSSVPLAVASQNAVVSGVTSGTGVGSVSLMLVRSRCFAPGRSGPARCSPGYPAHDA